MGKTLIIAEKPSVAADIVKALPGKFSRSKSHFESDDHIVSFAIGHLVSIAYPEEINPELQKWTLDNLPILPEEFPLAVLPDTKTQFNAISKLIRRKDVDVIVNGCDAGREGELIFKYILKLAANHAVEGKQIRRLWLRSMTLDAIREGLRHLRDNSEMLPLEDTALCRSEADWLIGINATRALTCYNSRFGGFRKTPCGRVQTPTLSLLVKRETERRGFVPVTYWELHARFDCGPVSYEGIWIDPDFVKEDEQTHGRRNRIWEAERARNIAEMCLGRPAEVEESSKKSTKGAPPLYDLTLLQREANSRFGFSAKNTLALAQGLYERHKLITYPRTDSRCLPEDYLPTVKEVLSRQRDWQFGRFAAEVLTKKYLKKDKRIFNNKKVSDHFAIIPTSVLPTTLSEPELKVYQMIVQRFLAVFFPPAVYQNTRRLSVVAGETFLTEGKILVEPGWKAVYGSLSEEDGDKELQALPPDTMVICAEIDQQEHQTKPPPRFTEATLLSAMENSGKLVEDEELAEAMKERGLGTPATRASIIEKLLNEKYVVREQRDLAPTGKAFELLSLLESRHIDVLASPELTGEWEYKLNQILKGTMTRPQFMKEIREMTGVIVEKVRQGDEAELREAAFSPVAGVRFYETASAYESADKKLIIRKILGGRVMEEEEIVALIEGKTLGPFPDFRSKKGKPFTASVRITDSKVEFLFADSTAELDLDEIRRQEPLGLSPIDQTRVFETPIGYLSESALEGDRDKGLRISKIILGRRLDPDHISQLLSHGRTELITGFISRKRKPFDAYLLLDARGKLTFEFPPRSKKGASRIAGNG
ncbi:DNA topoisomerase III [Desulfobulbus alkaliphilus]|uniref:DNA topoisomerase III n=1 Tax=Desulfobulbus alkaliphilus TaxID=869814 RepID=UPI0019661E9B|nr:DNA topoisomerase III [Desulfobulbus alkaliphilus]MBM9536919.1 DNA topoisomerase III [Desulfobulbus alkaliphilus]